MSKKILKSSVIQNKKVKSKIKSQSIDTDVTRKLIVIFHLNSLEKVEIESKVGHW
jgi:hypothetical protein